MPHFRSSDTVTKFTGLILDNIESLENELDGSSVRLTLAYENRSSLLVLSLVEKDFLIVRSWTPLRNGCPGFKHLA